jgi:hypothetical protein
VLVDVSNNCVGNDDISGDNYAVAIGASIGGVALAALLVGGIMWYKSRKGKYRMSEDLQGYKSRRFSRNNKDMKETSEITSFSLEP